jgi:hypothetical protein
MGSRARAFSLMDWGVDNHRSPHGPCLRRIRPAQTATSPTSTAPWVRRFRVLMAQSVDASGTVAQVGVSTGAAVGRPGDDPDEVMIKAEQVMCGMQSLRRHRRAGSPIVPRT